VPRALGPGSIVFLVSDFLAFPAEDAWVDAAARSWDVVPVVAQDPIWERSFPHIAGVCVPLADPAGSAEACARREANEARFDSILGRLEDLALEPVVIESAEPESIFEALLLWAEARRNGLAWTG
jgi:hypothetical protein